MHARSGSLSALAVLVTVVILGCSRSSGPTASSPADSASAKGSNYTVTAAISLSGAAATLLETQLQWDSTVVGDISSTSPSASQTVTPSFYSASATMRSVSGSGTVQLVSFPSGASQAIENRDLYTYQLTIRP